MIEDERTGSSADIFKPPEIQLPSPALRGKMPPYAGAGHCVGRALCTVLFRESQCMNLSKSKRRAASWTSEIRQKQSESLRGQAQGEHPDKQVAHVA